MILRSFRAFKESLAGLLSEACCVVEPHDDQIRDRISYIMSSAKDKIAVSRQYKIDFHVPHVNVIYIPPKH